MEKIYKNKPLLFLLAGGFVWWKYGKMGTLIFDKAFFLAAVAIIFIFIADGYERAWKYDSPQIVTANDHGSCDMRITPAGQKYVLIKKGSILVSGWYSQGGEGTYVLPIHLVNQFETVITSSAVVQEVELGALPPAAFNILNGNKEFKPPYLYGEAPISAISADETVDELVQKINTLNRQVNWYQDRVSDLTQEIERYMSHTYRLADRKTWYKLLVGKEEDND